MQKHLIRRTCVHAAAVLLLLLVQAAAPASAFLQQPGRHHFAAHRSRSSKVNSSSSAASSGGTDSSSAPTAASDAHGAVKGPRVVIEYCPGCKWMLRSAWLAQELLSTFEKEIGEVALQPSAESGTFIVSANGVPVWERKRDGGFPEAKVLKQRVRDVIQPQKDLGHSECKPS